MGFGGFGGAEPCWGASLRLCCSPTWHLPKGRGLVPSRKAGRQAQVAAAKMMVLLYVHVQAAALPQLHLLGEVILSSVSREQGVSTSPRPATQQQGPGLWAQGGPLEIEGWLTEPQVWAHLNP